MEFLRIPSILSANLVKIHKFSNENGTDQVGSRIHLLQVKSSCHDKERMLHWVQGIQAHRHAEGVLPFHPGPPYILRKLSGNQGLMTVYTWNALRIKSSANESLDTKCCVLIKITYVPIVDSSLTFLKSQGCLSMKCSMARAFRTIPPTFSTA